MFSSFNQKQVETIYELGGDDFDTVLDCLLSGPSLAALVQLLNSKVCAGSCPRVQMQFDEQWAQLVCFYKKMPMGALSSYLRVTILNQPALEILVELDIVVYSFNSISRIC